MKKIIIPAILALLLCTTCKKKDGSPADNTYTVEYRIDPINSFFTHITYTDANGNLVDITDFEKMVGGKKSINVTTKPFTAKIITEVTNTSNDAFSFTLQIWVNGELKDFESRNSAPNTTSTASMQFTVN
jgi:hypothetical protein